MLSCIYYAFLYSCSLTVDNHIALIFLVENMSTPSRACAPWACPGKVHTNVGASLRSGREKRIVTVRLGFSGLVWYQRFARPKDPSRKTQHQGRHFQTCLDRSVCFSVLTRSLRTAPQRVRFEAQYVRRHSGRSARAGHPQSSDATPREISSVCRSAGIIRSRINTQIRCVGTCSHQRDIGARAAPSLHDDGTAQTSHCQKNIAAEICSPPRSTIEYRSTVDQ